MSPDMAGFGLIFQNDANQFGIICVLIEKAKTRPVRGPGLQKSTSERDWGLGHYSGRIRWLSPVDVVVFREQNSKYGVYAENQASEAYDPDESCRHGKTLSKAGQNELL